jgi:hypothetical protein
MNYKENKKNRINPNIVNDIIKPCSERITYIEGYGLY